MKVKDGRDFQKHIEFVEEHVRKQSPESLQRITNIIDPGFDAEVSATRGELDARTALYVKTRTLIGVSGVQKSYELQSKL